ncbi:MAG: cbb3-type cytochrome c oxidase subunit I [Elusimicrobia bacterium]|nr:cbb3-type cytochrome c oxidase subunit I [Elusimicrobiota bacterium]
MIPGLVRGIIAGVISFLGFFFLLKIQLSAEASAAIAYVAAIPVYLAVGGGGTAFRRWLNEEEEPEIHGISRYLSFNSDHKVVGVQYLFASFFLFFFAGIMAMIMRTELARAGLQFMSTQTYSTVMGSHGIGMVLVALTAIVGGFGNYVVPLQIGAKDMAFPRLNALSFWLLPPAVLILVSALFNGGFDFGWTAYAPLSTKGPVGKLFFLLAFATSGFSSIFGGVNLLVTIIRMRAKGMTFFKIPIFVHSIAATAVVITIATSVVASSLFMVIFDRVLNTSFFDPARGGSVILFQHLFWFYSHPAVYIMILPAFGLLLEVLPVFSRKPLFAYPLAVLSLWIIVVLSFVVWAHHMFTSGMWGLLNFPFLITTELISIPTGIMFLASLGTLWRGQIRFTTPTLFAVGVIANFLIGGLTGIFLADVPSDVHLHDTLFVTAHFHFTIVGGTIFAMFAGVYYWFPKMAGRLYNETLGRWHFALFFYGFNATFIPMFWTGTHGLRRRVADFPPEMGPLQMWISVSAFVIFISVAIFLFNMIRSLRRGPPASGNPWNAQTLEWTLSSPPPAHNFDSPPEVHSTPYDFGRSA